MAVFVLLLIWLLAWLVEIFWVGFRPSSHRFSLPSQVSSNPPHGWFAETLHPPPRSPPSPTRRPARTTQTLRTVLG